MAEDNYWKVFNWKTLEKRSRKWKKNYIL
jgi:hypothetical protein